MIPAESDPGVKTEGGGLGNVRILFPEIIFCGGVRSSPDYVDRRGLRALWGNVRVTFPAEYFEIFSRYMLLYDLKFSIVKITVSNS